MKFPPKCPDEGMKTHGIDAVEIDGIKFRRRIAKGRRHGNFSYNLKLYQYLILKKIGHIPENMHIHHKDFDKDNNLIENLQVLSKKEHMNIHYNFDKIELKCAFCGKKFIGKRDNKEKRYCSKKCSLNQFEEKNSDRLKIDRAKYYQENKEKYKKMAESRRSIIKEQKKIRRKLMTREQKDKENLDRREQRLALKLIKMGGEYIYCDNCGKKFIPIRFYNKDSHCCSPKCNSAYQYKKRCKGKDSK